MTIAGLMALPVVNIKIKLVITCCGRPWLDVVEEEEREEE